MAFLIVFCLGVHEDARIHGFGDFIASQESNGTFRAQI